MGSNMAIAGAYRKEGSIGGRVGVNNRVGIGGRVGTSNRVGISGRVGIRANSSKDAFRPPKIPLLHGASSVVYSGGVGK